MVKSAGPPWWLCWPLGPSVAKVVGIPCRVCPWELWSLPPCGSYWLPLPFSYSKLSSIHLSFSGLWVGWIQSGSFFVQWPQKAGEADQPSFSPGKGNSFEPGSSLLEMSSFSLGDGTMQAKWSCSSFAFCVFLGILFHCVAKFLKWTSKISQGYFCSWVAV